MPAADGVADCLHRLFSCPDATVRELLALLARSRGRPGPADLVARRLGLRSRYVLAHRLRQNDIPPLSDLEAITRVLTWVYLWREEHVTLCRQATEAGADPASWYRTVQRVTQEPWSTVARLAPQQLLSRLREGYGSDTSDPAAGKERGTAEPKRWEKESPRLGFG